MSWSCRLVLQQKSVWPPTSDHTTCAPGHRPHRRGIARAAGRTRPAWPRRCRCAPTSRCNRPCRRSCRGRSRRTAPSACARRRRPSGCSCRSKRGVVVGTSGVPAIAVHAAPLHSYVFVGYRPTRRPPVATDRTRARPCRSRRHERGLGPPVRPGATVERPDVIVATAGEQHVVVLRVVRHARALAHAGVARRGQLRPRVAVQSHVTVPWLGSFERPP